MADGMCGPSNPLQNFQKHSTVDKTLQQDRLVSRPSPSQGFRSSPGPNAGLIDPEFEAFQAGQLPLDHGFHRQQFPAQSGFHQQPQPGPSAAWVADFQSLNISGPPPQFLQQPFTPQQAQQRHDTGGWHQDFARQQSEIGNAVQSMINMSGQTNSAIRYSPLSGISMVPRYSGGVAGQQAEMSRAQQKQPDEAFDEEAFAKAFEAAAQAEMASKEQEGQHEASQQETSQGQSQGIEMGQDIEIDEWAERLMGKRPLDKPIGADTIADPKLDPKIDQQQNSPDALARTAGQLLDSVRHDRSTKFQNSQFLELMRQFRDKEATVEGDKIVGTRMNNDIGAGGVEADGMAGMSGGDEAIKDEIALLSEKLREIALNEEKPFVRTPQNLRNLLHTLIHLHAFLPNTNGSPLYNLPPSLSSTLATLSSHPVLSQIPSIQEIITSIQRLRFFPKTGSALAFAQRRTAKIVSKADEWVVFTPVEGEMGEMGETGGQGQEEDIVGRWQSDRFPERTGEQEAEGEESIESRVARIRARVAELLGNVETPTMATKEEKEAKAMWNVLGYTITETGNEELDKEILAIHKQRMEDILGEQIGGKAG